MLTQARVKDLFDYDNLTGDLLWKQYMGNRKIGSPAGFISGHGHLQTAINGRSYLNHRLIWLWVHGYFPENDIDHVNRDKLDNRLENLREISHQCNVRNSGNPKNNTSGIKGVCWANGRKKWVAFLTLNGKQISLGTYSDFDNAVCARLAGEQVLNWSGCDSSSPAFKYVRDNIQGPI